MLVSIIIFDADLIDLLNMFTRVLQKPAHQFLSLCRQVRCIIKHGNHFHLFIPHVVSRLSARPCVKLGHIRDSDGA